MSAASLKRQNLFDTMRINPNRLSEAQTIVDRLIANKSRYTQVSYAFPNPGLKWWLVACLHQMECSGDFTKYLGNGQDLNKVTTKVPKGRGPFTSFLAGAIDAIKLDGLDKVTDWSMGNLLFILESYNGLGYELYHPEINSPYIWAGTNQYSAGKYEEIKDANGIYQTHFNPTLVSNQIGIAIMLKLLLAA